VVAPPPAPRERGRGHRGAGVADAGEDGDEDLIGEGAEQVGVGARAGPVVAAGQLGFVIAVVGAVAECIRGERGCIFASPLSSVRKMHPAMLFLLEAKSTRHSVQREAKKRLPRAVGLSLTYIHTYQVDSCEVQ